MAHYAEFGYYRDEYEGGIEKEADFKKCRRIAEVKSRMDRKFSRIENLWPRDGSCPLPLRSKSTFGKCFRIVKAQKQVKVVLLM